MDAGMRLASFKRFAALAKLWNSASLLACDNIQSEARARELDERFKALKWIIETYTVSNGLSSFVICYHATNDLFISSLDHRVPPRGKVCTSLRILRCKPRTRPEASCRGSHGKCEHKTAIISSKSNRHPNLRAAVFVASIRRVSSISAAASAWLWQGR